MLSTILACEAEYGTVTHIEAPAGRLDALLVELAERLDLLGLVVEGTDALLHVEAGGTDWRFGGWE